MSGWANRFLFAGYLLGQKTTKASAASHKNYSNPEALETNQPTNRKSYCNPEGSSDHAG